MHTTTQIARATKFMKREMADAVAKWHDGTAIGYEGGFVVYVGFGQYVAY